MRQISIFLSAIALIIIAGCATAPGKARNVLVERDGGIVSIPVTDKSYEERANREKARALIMQKCGSKFEITREEEVDVGILEETFVKSDQPATSNKTVVRSKRCEYRIWYRCQ